MVIFNESLFEEPTELMMKMIIGEQEVKKDWSHQDNDENKTSTTVNGWQLAKMKKSIPDMSLPWNL